MDESIFNYLRDVLLFRFQPNLDADGRAAHTHFVLKFQQTTGPVMAKGLEDTVFYIYNRLTALNEVGGEPQQFRTQFETFHERNLDRQRNWPATLLATSTHDTKRSEDVRARIVAISEIPELWRRSLQRWQVANRRWKRTINDLEAPDANEEYLLYQTCWARGRYGKWRTGVRGNAELHRANSSVHGEGAPRSEDQHELDPAKRGMGRGDARFRCESFGCVAAKQVHSRSSFRLRRRLRVSAPSIRSPRHCLN